MGRQLIFTKLVDKSVLYQGLTFPVAIHNHLYSCIGKTLVHGDSVIITIHVKDKQYSAKLENLNFNQEKHSNRSDIVQIRYSGELAECLRKAFPRTFRTVSDYLATKVKGEPNLKINEAEREFIRVYTVDNSPKFEFECIALNDIKEVNSEAEIIDTRYLRNIEDVGSNVPEKRSSKSSAYVRNQSVVEIAKARAKGICQLCGNPAPFKDKNGNPYLEVHHIIWLSRGGTDKVSNAVALCPNCHSRMHVLDDQAEIEYLLSTVAD